MSDFYENENNSWQNNADTRETEQESPKYEYQEPRRDYAGGQSFYDPNYRRDNPDDDKRHRRKKGVAGKVALIIGLVLLVGGIVGGGIWSIYQLSSANEGESIVVQPETNATAPEKLPEESIAFPNEETTAAAESQIQQATIPSTGSQAVGGVYVTDVSMIVEQALPSVVAITNTIVYENFYQNYWGYFGFYGQNGSDTYEVTGSGSGIILGDNGSELWIVSNNHVVEGATSLTVTFSDGSTADAYIKGTDASNDLAMVGVKMENLSDATKAAIRAIEVGDSDTLKMGEGVIAIGNALGFGQSVTTGCISALDREVQMSDGSTMTLLQTDAAINPGNSGGALLDRDGKLIGINVSKYADTEVEGMGFAIPISSAKSILDELSLKEPEPPRTPVSEEEYPYLGLQLKDISSTMVSGYGMPAGIMVYYVEEGGPAEKGGIQTNDIITKFDGREVTSYDELSEELQYHAGGTTVTVTVMRIDQGRYVEKELDVTLGFRIDNQD